MGEDGTPQVRETNGAERTAVLLGAGASADAGLLLTSELAAAIVEKANQFAEHSFEPAVPDWVRALNAAYAGMVGYRGNRGDNPLSAVNIETLISAVRLLRARDDHEVAPFVASWTPALSNFGSSELPTRSAATILRAVSGSFSGMASPNERDISEAVAELARAAVRPDLERPFADAETFILRSLVELLGEHKDVAYFEPLLDLVRRQPGGVDVITLNYDLTIETAAANGRVTVNRGIESWRPGENLDFAPVDGTLNLMKLHGSLDWRSSKRGTRGHPQLSPHGIDIVMPGAVRDVQPPDLPWIVVGDREKLATDGPTLALNFAARSALLRTHHLAVIGYSFGDAHINAMIRDWLAADPARTMSVLDIRWPRERYYRPNLDFRSALIAGFGRQRDYQGHPTIPRVVPVEGTTSERLSDVLHARPRMAPDPLATAVASREDAALRIDVTWNGPELADATLVMRLMDGPNYRADPGVSLYEAAAVISNRSQDRVWAPPPSYETWPTGVTKTVYAAGKTELPAELTVEGASIIGAQSWSGSINDEPSGINESITQE